MDSPAEDMDYSENTAETSRSSPWSQNVFDLKHLQYSTKKAKLARGECRTPGDHAPPRPPVKSAPPVSRVFYRSKVFGPVSLSFRKAQSLESPHYSPTDKKTYFEQCFVKIKKLGQGSFGEVFKVLKKEDQKHYAVKKAHCPFRTAARRQRSLEEVKQYEKLPPHPNIVQFFLAWEEDDILYMQLELCEESLSQYSLQDHHISERRIWNFFADLLFAVRHLHNHGMLHMDIKPENIFLSFEQTCKLGDLGLMVHNCPPNSDADEGDARYLAREAMNGNPGKASDIFSLGVTLLELATDLDIPKKGAMWQQLRQGWLPYDLMQDRSEKLVMTIAWMLHPRFHLRPSVENILEHPEIFHNFVDRERLYNFPRKIVKKVGALPLKILARRQSGVNLDLEDGAVAGVSEEDMLDVSVANDSRATDEVDGLLPTCNAVLTRALLPQDPELYRERMAVSEPVRRSRAMFPQTPQRHNKMPRRDSYENHVGKDFDPEEYGMLLGFKTERNMTFLDPEADNQEDVRRNCAPKNLLMLFEAAVDDEESSPKKDEKTEEDAKTECDSPQFESPNSKDVSVEKQGSDGEEL